MAQRDVFRFQHGVAELAVLVVHVFESALRFLVSFGSRQRFDVAVTLISFDALNLFFVSFRGKLRAVPLDVRVRSLAGLQTGLVGELVSLAVAVPLAVRFALAELIALLLEHVADLLAVALLLGALTELAQAALALRRVVFIESLGRFFRGFAELLHSLLAGTFRCLLELVRDRSRFLAVELRVIELGQLLGRFVVLTLLQSLARLLQRLGRLQRLAHSLHGFIGRGDVELGGGGLQRRLHLGQLRQSLAQIDSRLFHLFRLREHLLDECFDFRAVIFRQLFEELLEIFFDDLCLGDDRIERP